MEIVLQNIMENMWKFSRIHKFWEECSERHGYFYLLVPHTVLFLCFMFIVFDIISILSYVDFFVSNGLILILNFWLSG